MAIDLATGFNIGSKDAIDERQVLTLEQMKNLDESIYPDKYFAVCKDDGKLYLFNASNEVNDETGKFRVLEGSAGTVDLTGYKKTYTSKGELFVGSSPTSIKDIILKLEHGEMFLDYTINHTLTWFPVSEAGVFRIIKGRQPSLLDTTVEWFGASGAYAFAVLDESVGVERWVVIRETGQSVYDKNFSINKWNLLAKIKLSSSANTKHILSFSCLNKVPAEGTNGRYTFYEDADLCKYELHFTTPDLTKKLTQFGLVLYEYPMPEGTADGLKNLSKNIGLYYDEDNLSIYIFIINTTDVNYLEGRYIGSGLLNVSLEHTGEGVIDESYMSSSMLNWDYAWGDICAFEDLEFPTIVPIGGDGDGAVDLSGYAKTYTSLADLELTSSATINEVISKLSPGDVFTCSVTSFSSYQTMFPYIDSYDSDAFVFIHRGRTPVMSYAKWYKRDGSSEALAQFNALTGYIGGWTTFTTKKTYTTLTQLQLSADATITQVVNKMLEGERFRSIVTRFNNYQTMFPYEEEEDQNAYVLIDKLNGNAVYVAWYRIDGTKHYIGHYINNTLQNWVNYSPTSDLSEYAKTFTSLDALGLTAPVSVGEVFNAMPDNTMAVLACEAKDETDGTVNISDIPMSFGVLTIKKNEQGRFSIDYQNSLASAPCNVKRWIGTLKGADGTGLYWKLVSTQTYTSLTELGLDTTATLNDIVGAMKDNTTFTYKTDAFDYANEYNNIQYGVVTIDKQSTARVQVLLTDKNTGNLYVGRMDTNNLFVGWRSCTFHRVTAQTTAGYFKFKPTSDGGFEQPLRISVTDNYGGMIEISGSAPSQTQYKPFKCVRLSHGTYTDYNASNPTNNKMEKLFFLDGYMYLQVASYTTVTFTGLVGAPTFVETIDTTTAVEIPIVSVIATQFDAYGDPYIISIGDSVSGDGSIQTLASLGLSTDIMTWKTGIYKVSHVSGLTGLPSDITNTSPGFRLEHHNIKKWNSNHNPSAQTWGQRHSIIYCDNGNVYHRFYESGATAGTYITDTGWQKICVETESKKEEDSYIPDMYDRNANGDIPVVPFDRLANFMAVRSNRGLVSTSETEATYDEDYVGGYVFAGANDVLVKDKEMFNKIKVLVHIPGVLRIGVVNENIYGANPRYSTCLVKWLVADFVAFTGMKEYDIADTVLEEGQSIFLECRTGVSSWYLNTGEATQVGAVTYPASSCTTGLNVADALDTTTNNALFKSQKVNSSSCLTSFGNGMYSIGGKIRGNFQERAYNSGATSSKEAYENTEYFGGLNIGLYRRTKYSDTRFCKCVENAMSPTFTILSNSVRIWFSTGQEALEGKSVYAIKLDVHTPGNLTICHCKGTTVDDFQIIDKYTHYVRAKGLQTIHLPFDIKLNKGEYIGLGGFHCKSTADNIVVDTCRWHYVSLNEVSTCSWMNTIGKTGFYSLCIDPTQYPEVCTSVSSKNSGYINVELICRGEKRSPLEDKYISFTGDSITTFAGFCTTQTGYPEGNPAGDNAVYYPASGKVINNVDATWWGILAKDNRMKILRNDAWSGSRVSSTTGSTDTKCLCGTNRRYYLRNGYAFATNSTYPYGRPEIIVSMIGTNDLSGGVELGEEMFKGVMGAEEEYKTILSAFSLFCRRIHDQEGQGGVKIVHFLIPRGSDYGYANANGVTIADLSLRFERIAKAWGQYFIPLSYFNGIKPNTPKRWSCPTGSMFKNTAGVEFPSADGLHPNAMGMEAIADGVHRFLCSIM